MNSLLMHILVQFSVYCHHWVEVAFSVSENFIWSLLVLVKVPIPVFVIVKCDYWTLFYYLWTFVSFYTKCTL